jgi:hypothetical protein
MTNNLNLAWLPSAIGDLALYRVAIPYLEFFTAA